MIKYVFEIDPENVEMFKRKFNKGVLILLLVFYVLIPLLFLLVNYLFVPEPSVFVFYLLVVSSAMHGLALIVAFFLSYQIKLLRSVKLVPIEEDD